MPKTAKAADSKADYKRLTINLAPELHNELVERADRRGITVTELIRRAVALDKLVDETTAGNGRILIEREDTVREVVLL